MWQQLDLVVSDSPALQNERLTHHFGILCGCCLLVLYLHAQLPAGLAQLRLVQRGSVRCCLWYGLAAMHFAQSVLNTLWGITHIGR